MKISIPNPFKRKRPSLPATRIPSDGLSLQEKQVRTMIERERKRTLRTRQGVVVICTVMLGSNFVLAAALYGAYPLIRLVPLMIQIRKDGSIDSEPLMSMMSIENAQDPVERATLWQYVEYREGYSNDTAQFRRDYVVALSSGDVGASYTQWYNYPNPDSPQVRYGKNHGVVSIIFDNADFTSDPNVYKINYYREVRVPGQTTSKSHWTAYVHYELVTAIPAIERGTMNPAAMKVTGYSVTETDDPGVKP